MVDIEEVERSEESIQMTSSIWQGSGGKKKGIKVLFATRQSQEHVHARTIGSSCRLRGFVIGADSLLSCIHSHPLDGRKILATAAAKGA